MSDWRCQRATVPQFPKWESVTELYTFWILAEFRIDIHRLTV
jgi:hypothetical protein